MKRWVSVGPLRFILTMSTPTLNTWQRCLRTGERLDIEYRLRKATGTYIWFRARAAPLRDEQGSIVRWYGAAEDIHDRKSIDLALRESEAFSRSILKSSPDAIMVVDHEGHLEFMNQRGLAAFDVAILGEVKNKPWLSLWPETAQKAAGGGAVAGVCRPAYAVRHL